MSQKLSQRYSEYVNELFTREDETLRYVRQQTVAHGIPLISLEPNEAKLLQMLVRLCGAERVVEVGTLAGYSGICIARVLPAHGKLITIEVSSVHAEVARAHFEHAGLADKVTVMQGAGIEVLPKLTAAGPYDLMFIDADKGNYHNYLAWAADNLRLAAPWSPITHSGVALSSIRKLKTTTPWLHSIAHWPRIRNSTAPSSKSAMASPSA